MRTIPVLLGILVVLLAGLVAYVGISMTENLVVSVIDGDTLVLKSGAKVRLIGIDAPEKGDYYYEQSKKKLEELVLNRTVSLEMDKSYADDYGRLLRYVYFNGSMINLVLVQEGYAFARPYPPDVKYRDEFARAELFAKQLKLGIWSSGMNTTLRTAECVALGCPEGTLFVGSRLSDKYHDCSSRWARMIEPENLVCFRSEEEAALKGYLRSE